MRPDRGFVGPARVLLSVAALLTSVAIATTRADDEAREPERMTLADGRLTLVVPKSWERRPPQTRIVEHEFAAPAAEGDSAEARITVMGAGGGVQANIDRWIDQFDQPDGGPSKDKTKIEKKEVAETDVYVVSITGTYKDRPGGGPFTQTPVVPRKDYRMLGAIIATPNQGQYFIKMYGPRKTIDAQQQAFEEMVASLKNTRN